MNARVLLTLLTLTSLSACGYKSGLYLPEAKAKAGKPAAVITPERAPDRPLPSEAAQPK